MEFSNAYARDLRTSFNSFSGYSNNFHNLQESPSFRKFLQVDTSKESFEIPTIMTGDSLSNILEGSLLVLPLYVGKDIGIYRTSDSVVRHLITASYEDRLVKARTSSGLTFYGGKGLILNERFNPLLLCTFKCHIEGISVGGTPPAFSSVMIDSPIVNVNPTVFLDTTSSVIVDSMVVHVNPMVFLDTTDLINKSIVKKVIPYYLSHSSYALISRNNWRVKSTGLAVVIEDMNYMFSDAPKGIVSDASVSDTLNTFLAENEHLLL